MFAYTVYININIIGAYLLTLIISYMNYEIGMHFHSVFSDWVVYHVHLRHGISVCWQLNAAWVSTRAVDL